MTVAASDSTIERCAEILGDLSFPEVRRWKQEHPGGKAVAAFPVYAPVELIHACGALPVSLNGAGDRLDIQHADARFGSFICSIVKTTLEMGMTNHLEVMDGILFSTICDSARNLCYVLKRNYPRMYVDFMHLPHNPAPGSGVVDFLTNEYVRIKNEIEAITGKKATDEALRHSIALFNKQRAMIRELYDLRAAKPEVLRTSELYTLMRAGNYMPIEKHNEWLAEALAELRTRTGKPRDSIRVVIEGSFCEQPPLDLIRIIEDAGCYMVDDDFILGRRWFTEDVPADGNPLRTLADSYVNRSVYSSVRHDFRKPREKELVKKVRARNAQAVIMLIAKFCEPALFDYVLFKRELEAQKIPHLLLEFEEKAFTFERTRTEVETFVESLLFE